MLNTNTMDSANSSENDFIAKLTELIETNIANPQFGVSMLAKEMGMSRSNLHRKVNVELKISVSQLIRQERLKKARNILRHTSETVSEVAYNVGFSNVSYFIKCFHEYYGYSPGEVGNRDSEENISSQAVRSNNKKLKTILIPIIFVVVLAVVSVVIFKPFQFQQKKLEKKIAILPPLNWETNDSTAIDGILQNVTDNLCILKDIEKVVPWISVLQYRNSLKPATVIARELKVNYIIKPVVRTINGKIYLSIPLIDGRKDKLLWSGNFEIDSNNITTVHQKIFKEIVNELDILITPTEQGKINKFITSNKKAGDYYWKGVKLLNLWIMGKKTDLQEAIFCFEKAIEYDIECASAYAQLARIYYIKDYDDRSRFSVLADEKIFSKQINKNADRALHYDSELDLSLIAKALYYNNEEDYEMAKLYLEKALKYNPKSTLVMGYLCFVYRKLGDIEKFIEFALNALNSDFPEIDNSLEIGKEYIYHQLGTVYRGMGFFDKALMYLNLGIEINPEYQPLIHEKSQVVLDLNTDYQYSKEILMDLIQSDSSNHASYNLLGLDLYILGDYTNALYYFNKSLEIKENKNLDINGIVLSRLATISIASGETEKAQEYINKYMEYIDTRVPKQKCYHLIRIYSLKDDKTRAIEQMEIYSQYNFPWHQIRLFQNEPIYDNIRDLPEFQKILSEMERKWYERNDSIKVSWKKKGLL